jgi:hypothetical protein
VAGVDGAPDAADLERYAGRYERTSRRFDVSVRDGRLAMELTMTGNLAALVEAEPEDLLLYPVNAPTLQAPGSCCGHAMTSRGHRSASASSPTARPTST